MWRYTTIYAALMGVIIIGEVAALASSRHTYLDPFADYERIVPGRSSAVLNDYPCSISRDETSTAHCDFRLMTGPIDSVTVVYGDVIKWLRLTIRPDEFELGDLVLCWGKPTSVDGVYAWADHGRFAVHWGDRRYAVIDADRYDDSLNYRLPIHEVMIADQWQACGSR